MRVFGAGSAAPGDPLRLFRFQVRKHGLAGYCPLPNRDQRSSSRRQINVDAGAEADEADALAGAHAITLVHECHDPARDEPGDLHDRDIGRRRSAR